MTAISVFTEVVDIRRPSTSSRPARRGARIRGTVDAMRLLRLLVVLAVTAGLLVACGHHLPPAALPSLPSGSTTAVLVEPDDGMDRLYGWLGAARTSLDLTVYELVDDEAERVLAADAARGVRVRVILDQQNERQANLPAYGFLRAHGVQVTWASSRYSTTHEKSFAVDGRALVVMTLNLASRYYATTRDFAVLSESPPDVAAFERVFAADWTGASTSTPPGSDLVWSPGQSASDFVALVDSAQRSIAIEAEEYLDPSVLAALDAAARRGVDVGVAMTYQKDWAPGWNALVKAGGHVSWFQGEEPIYVHAKVIAVDAGTPQARTFVGSENITTASLQHARELGIVLVGDGPATAVVATVDADLAAGRTWTP